MSYSYWVDACEFRIEKAHFKEIFKRAISEELYDPDDFTTDVDEPAFLQEFIEYVLGDAGFSVYIDGSGSVAEIEQDSDRLPGEIDSIFSLLAPFVEDGSYIKCRGEDGCLWRWRFSNGGFYSDDADIIYVPSGPPVCPIQKLMGGKNVCATCPFGLVCLCEENPRLRSIECSTCGGEAIMDNVTEEIIAGTTCTCHPRRFVERK